MRREIVFLTRGSRGALHHRIAQYAVHWLSYASFHRALLMLNSGVAGPWREICMASRVVEVVLPNNRVALVQAAEMDDDGGPAEKVGWKDTFDFEQVCGTLEGIAQ